MSKVAAKLEDKVARARLAAESARLKVENVRDEAVRVKDLGKEYVDGVSSGKVKVLPGAEPLLPGSLYIVISTLGGIIVSHRSPYVARRTLIPTVAFVGSFAWFLPQTFGVGLERTTGWKRPTLDSAVEVIKDKKEELKGTLHQKGSETVHSIKDSVKERAIAVKSRLGEMVAGKQQESTPEATPEVAPEVAPEPKLEAKQEPAEAPASEEAAVIVVESQPEPVEAVPEIIITSSEEH